MIKLSVEAYKSLIDADLKSVDEFMPKYSLEKSHVNSVLMNSLEKYYQHDMLPFSILEVQLLIVTVEEKIHKTSSGRDYFHYAWSLKKMLEKLKNIEIELLKF